MSFRNKAVATAVGAALAVSLPLIEKLEGVKYTPYRDVAGIPTVCAGITGPDVVMGKTYTKSECRTLLAKHVEFAQKSVDKAVKVDIPTSMRAAMYSFTFNAGTGAFRQSTMLKLINQGKLTQACEQLWSWTYYTDAKTGKKVKSKGLKNRRAEEYKYCTQDLK